MTEQPAEKSSPTTKQVIRAGAAASPENLSVVEYVFRREFIVPKQYRKQAGFFRMLKRIGSDENYKATIQQLRDTIIRSALNRKSKTTGLSIALAGVRGGEGTSLISVLLTLSLGATKHYRVAYLDGRFSQKRFDALSYLLSLSKNSCRVEKGASSLDGYYNERYPNVYLLKNSGPERSLEFFADKRLKNCLSELQQAFDFVIIDMPPLLKESSNTFLAPKVDDLYLVVNSGKTRLADIDKCREMMSDLGRDFDGVIVNRQKLPLWARLFWREYFF